MYLHPERSIAVSVGAPGAVTLLDTEQKWPKGIADVEDVFGISIDVKKIGKISVQLIIGSEDVLSHGGAEFWHWLHEVQGHSSQGATRGHGPRAQEVKKGRREHLQDLQMSLKDVGIDVSIEIVDGVAHSAAGVRAQVLSFAKRDLQPSAR